MCMAALLVRELGRSIRLSNRRIVTNWGPYFAGFDNWRPAAIS